MTTAKQSNNTVMYVIIGVLIALVAGMGGFLINDKLMGKPGPIATGTGVVSEPVTITAYTDARCKTCPTDQIVESMKNIPFLAGATFETKEFSETGVSDFLTANSITKLPAFVLSHGNVGDAQFKQVLMPIEGGMYMVNPQAVGANFDPYAKRSAKGFLMVDKAVVDEIKKESYLKGNTEAKITWLEYSDLECPYCAKLHNSGTIEEIEAKYGDQINRVFNHFPLDFHANAKPGALVLECLGKEKGADAFYSLAHIAFEKENSNKSFLIDEAVKLGATKATLEKCIDDKEFSAKVDAQSARGQTLFGVSGTPGSILINNETGEYDFLSGAYPTDSFTAIIDELLK